MENEKKTKDESAGGAQPQKGGDVNGSEAQAGDAPKVKGEGNPDPLTTNPAIPGPGNYPAKPGDNFDQRPA